jgi:glycosidase
MSSSFRLIYDAVVSKQREDLNYWIPKLWVTSKDVKVLEEKDSFVRVEPCAYLSEQFKLIEKKSNPDYDYRKSLSRNMGLSMEKNKIVENGIKRMPGDWLSGTSIYGIYVRNFTAFDHDQDGVLGGSQKNITLNGQGMKETGTFLKSMALLPYIKSLGFDTVYLLPVSQTGTACRKGELGSPYGMRNNFKIDTMFHDPLVDEYGVDVEFRAFVEAAHMMGLRVMLDFVPRTAARDSDFIKEHPDWFYWIDRSADKDYHSPEFTRDELNEIHHKVSHWHDTKEKHMIPPHADYVKLFNEPPQPETIEYISPEIGYVGKVNGKEVVVPGAFADWPPDDIQPPWTDVTYYKLYEDSEFNYVAYNTIRMYDSRIAKKNQPLWDTIANFIPFFQEEFGIDGARIDMGHALPHALEHMIIEKAREVDADFGFLAEDFNVWAQARQKGYNMVMGNSWYAFPRTMAPADNGDSMAKQFIKDLPKYPNPVWGSPETADTPRAAARKGGIKFSKAIWTIINTLPNTVPFCFSGFELGDHKPNNLGLDFEPEEIKVLSKKPLAFFDRAEIAWDSLFAEELIAHIRKMSEFRAENKGNIIHLDNFAWVENETNGKPFMAPENPVISFLRFFEENMVTMLTSGMFGEILYPIEVERDFLVVANMDFENEVISTVMLGYDEPFVHIFTGEKYKAIDGKMNLRLKPGEVILAVRD